MGKNDLSEWELIAKKFTKRALMRRWPKYKKQIERGDLKIGLGPDGCVFIEFPNTSIFTVGQQELAFMMENVFSEDERGSLGEEALLKAGIKSLTVSALVPRSQPKPHGFEGEA